VSASTETVGHFARHGWVLTEPIGPAGLAALRRWVDEIERWPEPGDGWLHHREMTDAGPKLCRSENLIPFHDGMRAFLTQGPMLDTATALLGEPAVLYKEKINYKLPGGAGYSPHQDAPAYPFVANHVSCMVAIDDATIDNGCLEVVSGEHHRVLPVDERGCIVDELVATFHWEPVPARAGQTLWFHSRTPHRSGSNRSSRARRALYPTYNASAEGDLREAYYRDKLATFAKGDAPVDRVQVSLIGDFEGRPVS
jgi:2-aminoethylphosphonate dioxygenase